MGRIRKRGGTLFVCALVSAGVLSAEPLLRLRGRVIAPGGDPVTGAEVRVEARFGFGGAEFSGQRAYSATTNAKGEWSIIGFTSGAWVFDASAPGYLPHVVALPFNVMTPAGQGLDTIPLWQPVLRLTQVPTGEVGRKLKEAEAAARLGQMDRVTPVLKELGIEGDPDILSALGHICLIAHDLGTARSFFHQAIDREPKSFVGMLGMASTALLSKDWDLAGRTFATARTLTSNKGEQAYITAAIRDLSKVHVTAPKN
jgi:carboxypeptidase family protein